jgi:hypothetical protein
MPISGLALLQAISTSQALSLLLERKKKNAALFSVQTSLDAAPYDLIPNEI